MKVLPEEANMIKKDEKKPAEKLPCQTKFLNKHIQVIEETNYPLILFLAIQSPSPQNRNKYYVKG